MQYALRLAKIEGFKAEERIKSGKADPCQMFGKADPTETFPQGKQGEVRDIVAAKLGRRIAELSRIYGIRNGSANPKGTEIGVSQTNGLSQEDLAQKLGISYKTLQRAKSLTTLPSEIQDLIEQGRFPK